MWRNRKKTMTKIAVQIGHWPVESGAAYEVETLKCIYPYVVARLRSAGYKVGEFDGSLRQEPANYQHDYDGAVFLHCDAGSATRTGFSIGYWAEAHPGSRSLAATLKEVYGKVTGLRFIGYNITSGEHHYYGNRRFTHSCKCTLLECGFVSNPNERAYLQVNGKKFGYAIADAYIEYFGGVQPKKEDDTMLYEEYGTKFIYGDCFVDKYRYWLHTLGNSNHVTFTLLSHATGKEKTTDGQDVSGHQGHPMDSVAATLGIKGSYTLICKALNPIRWSLREVPR